MEQTLWATEVEIDTLLKPQRNCLRIVLTRKHETGSAAYVHLKVYITRTIRPVRNGIYYREGTGLQNRLKQRTSQCCFIDSFVKMSPWHLSYRAFPKQWGEVQYTFGK